ncbi:50S ribosomal protein L10 [bacterium]|nr:50S ribosomal protein L10 [bacterium]PIV80878.1 MAG: 50S ribosomal protein L10 [bacterium CG17_big_fil_post_rev_8_21_14_2_50_64_8]PJA73242.1 MAG: 50S ribosomal protein L10 [bacterium CG_4_9_14_3_um_filter_65_15]
MARPEKVAEVKAIAERIEAAQSMVLADYSGLTVEQMTIFRSNCRSKTVDCRVVKNRLARIAADNAEMSVMKDHLKGPTAIIFGPESQVDPAKIAVEFAKDNEAMQIKGGFIDGQFLAPDQVVALSKTPSKDELIAKMLGSINSPATGIAAVLNGVIAGLARTIEAVAKQQAEAAG